MCLHDVQELLEETKAFIHKKQEGAVPLRRAWEAWNPHRAAFEVPPHLLTLLYLNNSSILRCINYGVTLV